MHFHDLGKLMLAFVMLWAYFSFSQFLIIWAGNLPEEIPFYLERLRGGWQYVSLLLVFGQFVAAVLPAALARPEARPQSLARSRWFILAMRLVDSIWLVAPNFNHEAASRSAWRTSASRCAVPASGCTCSPAAARSGRWCRSTIRTSRRCSPMGSTPGTDAAAHPHGSLENRRRARSGRRQRTRGPLVRGRLVATTFAIHTSMWGLFVVLNRIDAKNDPVPEPARRRPPASCRRSRGCRSRRGKT